MRYLKLFEDHKETSDKILEIEKNAQKQKEEVINNYKLLADEMLYDITDDYNTESVIRIKEFNAIGGDAVKTYIDYNIEFTLDKYEDLLNKLDEILSKLKEGYDINYYLFGVKNTIKYDSRYYMIHEFPNMTTYPKRSSTTIEVRKVIQRFIKAKRKYEMILNASDSDIKLELLISF